MHLVKYIESENEKTEEMKQRQAERRKGNTKDR
jgi:hypothetical protein